MNIFEYVNAIREEHGRISVFELASRFDVNIMVRPLKELKGCLFFSTNSNRYRNRAEIEANLFAANLLLDDDDVFDLLVQGYTVSQVASIQKVPQELVTIKADDMAERGFELRRGFDVDANWLR